MDNEDLEPSDGGATSIERRGIDPICSFDPETGFEMNPQSLNELRWYAYLSVHDDDGGVL